MLTLHRRFQGNVVGVSGLELLPLPQLALINHNRVKLLLLGFFYLTQA